ncbi:MAG: sigma-70 family RNA polymerase sigma factor [Clostridia bacterium]|nr:sigma-70 family RNA polymerase sigma factor [Clostridia bacterium]
MNEITELLIKVRNNDDSAFEILCGKYNALIDSMSKKYSEMYPGEVDISSIRDDFSQEAKLAFYNACLKFNIENDKVTFGAFAKTCIRNRLVSYLRCASSKKRRKSKSNDEDNTKSLQDTVIQRELEEKLISLAEKVLSNYELRIFRMYARGAKAKEISAKIGKDEKSVNNAIFRIRSKLKKQSNLDT